jgi:hypothetical protein
MSSPTGLTYQWKKNGVIISGATSNVLDIQAVGEIDDNSVFEVVVTNLNGSVSSYRANLDVLRKVKIIEHPTSQMAVAGQNVTLYVKVSGDGPFTFLWRKDGALIAESYVDSYTISNITLADAGNYNVIVKNDFSQAMSNIAVITVLQKPEIIINPSITTIQIDPVLNITKIIPEKIRFDLNVSAKGTPPLSTQWRKDGINIPGATNNLFSLVSPLTTDSGVYDAVVSNIAGEDISARYELKVLAPPRITVQPVLPPKIILGDNVTFTATATGSPELKYQWRKNNNVIPSADSTTITLQAIPENYGDYTLYVWNEVGNTTSVRVSLTDANVLKKPEIIKHPLSLITKVGGVATFTVTATGSPTLTYQWKKGNVNILGANFATYTINPVLDSSAGDFNVVVSNPAGSAVSNVATLSVGRSPTIVVQPSSVNVIITNNTEFTVTAAGTEVLTYQWRKNNIDIPNATLSSFPLFNVQQPDVASYDVVIKNDYGTVTSSKATLTLLYPPKITGNPSGGNFILGANIQTLTATATGTAPLQYQWRFNGENITGATTTNYNIPSFSASNEGVYDLIVSNSIGSVTSLSAGLKLVTPPSIKNIIISNALSSTTYNIATKNITADILSNKLIKIEVETEGDDPINIAYSTVYTHIVNISPYSESTIVMGLSSNSFDILEYDWSFSKNLTWNKKIIYFNSANRIVPSNIPSYNPTLKANPFSINITLSNPVGTRYFSNAIKLNMSNPLVITLNPVGGKYLSAASVSMKVAATGPSSINYQWRLNGINIPGATSTTYTINSLSAIHVGDYDVIVKSTYETLTSSKATLQISKPTQIKSLNFTGGIYSDDGSVVYAKTNTLITGNVEIEGDSSYALMYTREIQLYQNRTGGYNTKPYPKYDYPIYPKWDAIIKQSYLQLASPKDSSQYVWNNTNANDTWDLIFSRSRSLYYYEFPIPRANNLSFEFKSDFFNIGKEEFDGGHRLINPNVAEFAYDLATTDYRTNYIKDYIPWTFSVYLSNVSDTTISKKIFRTIKFVYPLGIRNQPVGGVSPKTLSIVLTGTEPSYQWYINNTIINAASASTYSATSAGNYKCVVSNLNGSLTSNEVILT